MRILPNDRGTDDIIEAVADGKSTTPFANKDIAMINKSYFENLNIDVAIDKPEPLHWAVRKKCTLHLLASLIIG